MLDIRTLFILKAFAAFAVGTGMLLAAAQYPRRIKRSMSLWGMGGLLLGSGFCLLALSGSEVLPEPVVLIGGTVVAMSGGALLYAAIMEIRQLPYSKYRLIAIISFTFVANCYAYYVGNLAFRVVVNSAAAALLSFMPSYVLLFVGTRSKRPIYRLTGMLFAVSGLVWVARAGNSLILSTPIIHPLADNWLQALGFLMLFMNTVIIPVYFALIIAEELNEELHRLATLDSLTQIYNRRTFEELADKQLSQAERYGTLTSLLMVDIDHFKRVNDGFGHAAGDNALIKAVEVMADSLRINDVFCRYGGEEFCVLLPETGVEDAAVVAERLRRAMMDTDFRDGDSEIPLTVSVGVACLESPPFELKGLRLRADEALYRAKQTGRNRVVIG